MKSKLLEGKYMNSLKIKMLQNDEIPLLKLWLNKAHVCAGTLQ